MALLFSIFLVTSFIEDFLFISFQQKNEIKKGNTLMEFKYLLSCPRIDLFDVKDFKRNSTDGIWSGDVFKEYLMLQFWWLQKFRLGKVSRWWTLGEFQYENDLNDHL